MSGALLGVAVIATLIILGWAMQRTRAFPIGTSEALTAFAYWAATPALLFSVLSQQDLRSVIGAPFLVAAASGFGSALVFTLVAMLLRTDRANLTLGAMGASLNNIAYIGIPVATYVLGSAHHIVPVLAFQLGFFTPMYFVLAELAGKKGGASIGSIARTVITNPLVVAALVGVLWNLTPLAVPLYVSEVTSFLGSAAPPTVLVAFGASLVGQSIHLGKKIWFLVSWSTACKLIVQPLIAWGVGLALGLSDIELAAAVIMGTLPAAQNVFIAAMRAGAGKEVAQGSVLMSSALSLPVIVGVAALLL